MLLALITSKESQQNRSYALFSFPIYIVYWDLKALFPSSANPQPHHWQHTLFWKQVPNWRAESFALKAQTLREVNCQRLPIVNQHKACEAVLKIISFERQTCDRQTETGQLIERGRIYNGLNCTGDDDQEKIGKVLVCFWFCPGPVYAVSTIYFLLQTLCQHNRDLAFEIIWNNFLKKKTSRFRHKSQVKRLLLRRKKWKQIIVTFQADQWERRGLTS